MKYDPLVEYYRDKLRYDRHVGGRPVIPSWRRFYGPLGVGYQQDGTGYVLPAGLAQAALLGQRS